MTTSVLKVMSALLADIGADRYGLDLIGDTGLASGTLYPILVRLERAGWVASLLAGRGIRTRAAIWRRTSFC